MPPDLIITIDDFRKAGHCPKGIRRGFDAAGLDFRRLLKEGYPASELIATGNALAIQVVERAVARRG